MIALEPRLRTGDFLLGALPATRASRDALPPELEGIPDPQPWSFRSSAGALPCGVSFHDAGHTCPRRDPRAVLSDHATLGAHVLGTGQDNAVPSGAGTPHLEVHLAGGAGWIVVRLGDAPDFNPANLTLWSDVNLFGSDAAGRCDLSHANPAGSTLVTCADARTAFGPHTIARIDFVAPAAAGLKSYRLDSINTSTTL